MKVKNLTSKVQELKIVEASTRAETAIYLEGNSTTDIDSSFYVPSPERYSGIFEFSTKVSHIVIEPVEIEVEDTHEVSEKPVTEEGDEVEDTPEETTVAKDKFICDICGAEFASSRGLASHKNRAHPE